MGEIFAAIGTPAQAPKPRGKSPGWTEGQTRTRRIRYPTVKKKHCKITETSTTICLIL